ncbi:MAG: YncE family protein, partial [Acidimicrobiia bacterium]
EPAGRVVPLPGHPEGLAFDPVTATLAAGVDGGVAVLDPDGASRTTLDLGARPRHVGLAENGGAVLVPLEGSDELVVVGLPAGEVRQRVAVGRQPHDAAAAAGRVFVGDELADTISVIEGSAVRATRPGPIQPGGVSASAGSVVVVGVRGRHLKVLDATTLAEVATLEAGVGPTHVVADQSFAYVADTQGDAILLYRLGADPERVGRVATPGTPYGLALDTARGRLWVTLTKTNELLEFNLAGEKLTRRAGYPTVRQPNSVAVDPRSGTVYVAGAADDQLQILTPER